MEPGNGNDHEAVQDAVAGLSVYESYHLAKAHSADCLVFLPGADNSIRKFAHYRNPEKLYRSLMHLAEASRRWADGSLGTSFAEFFASHGYRFSAHNPAAVDGRFKRHYTARYAGTTVLLQPHLKVDESTSPDQCLRIYWHRDNTLRVFVVGHVGRHLPQ